MSGVRIWAEEILRIEWRCSSVRRVLCEVLFIFIKENSCSHKYVLPNIESVWAAWEHRWGIVSGMKRGNSAAPTDSYFAFSVSLHWSSISSICRFDGALSTSAANGLLSSSNLLLGASKSANRRMKSAPSMPSFSVNCLVGKTAAATFSFIVWQCGKWLKFSWRICVSHRRSLVLKALTVASTSVMIRPRPWSCRISAFKWLVMSHRNILFRSSDVSFPLLSMNSQISSRNSKNLSSTFPWLSHRTSVW